jgi:hypothetical protein
MTLDYCDPQSGLCASKTVSEPFLNCTSETPGDPGDEESGPNDCDDGNKCTRDDCFPDVNNEEVGQCWYRLEPCNDFNPCTIDTCTADEGCLILEIPGCLGCTADSDCSDGDICTTDVCGKLGAAPNQCKNVPFVPGPGEETPKECL